MAKAMKRADVVKALSAKGCNILREGGQHTIWVCPCGQHKVAVPRHNETSAGVVRNIIAAMACLQEGWLQ